MVLLRLFDVRELGGGELEDGGEEGEDGLLLVVRGDEVPDEWEARVRRSE